MSDLAKIIGVASKLLPLFLGGNPVRGEPRADVTVTAKDAALMSLKSKMGSVVVNIGTRDTGKTELAYRLAEFLERPVFAVSPQQQPPGWITRIKLEDIVTLVPPRSTLLFDDVPAYLSNRDYLENSSQIIEKIVPMVRHERQPPDFPVGEVHLIFNTQSAAQADKYILDCDMAFLKPLGLLMDGIERPHIGKIYRELVNPCFDNKDDDFIHKHAFMLSRQYKGLIRFKQAR